MTQKLRIDDDHMVAVHIIRQDYARALSEYESTGSFEAEEELVLVTARRARAMRSLHRDDNATVREISAMFRTAKTTVREALSQGDTQ
jgi:hypothetical protein